MMTYRCIFQLIALVCCGSSQLFGAEVFFGFTFQTSLDQEDIVIAESHSTTLQLEFLITAQDGISFVDAKTMGEAPTSLFYQAVEDLTLSVNADALSQDLAQKLDGTRVVLTLSAEGGGSDGFLTLLGRDGGAMAVEGTSSLPHSPDRVDGRGGGSRESLIVQFTEGRNVSLTLIELAYTNAPDTANESDQANLSATNGLSSVNAFNLSDPNGTIDFAQLANEQATATPEAFILPLEVQPHMFLRIQPAQKATGGWNDQGAAIRGMTFDLQRPKAPEGGYRTGIAYLEKPFIGTDLDDYTVIKDRLDELENDLGAELLRIGDNLYTSANDSSSTFARELAKRSFKYKGGLTSVLALQEFVNYENETAQDFIPWEEGAIDIVRAKIENRLNTAYKSPIWLNTRYLVVPFSRDGEPGYPYGGGFKSLWCYGPHANPAFRRWLENVKYVAEANPLQAVENAWGLTYESFADIDIPAPETGNTSIWRDVLEWYRHEARNFAEETLKDWIELTDKQLILFIKGGSFDIQDEIEATIQDLGRTNDASVISMNDQQFIIDLAIKYDCDIQFTGLERGGTTRIASYAIAQGFNGLFYGETAGNQWTGNAPIAKEQNRYEGLNSAIDFHHSNWIYGDGASSYPDNSFSQKNASYDRLKKSFALAKVHDRRPDIQPDVPPTIELINSSSGAVIDPLTNIPSYIPENEFHLWSWDVVAEPGCRKGLVGEWRGIGKDQYPEVVETLGEPTWICLDFQNHNYFHASIYDAPQGQHQTPVVEIVLEYYATVGGGTPLLLQYDAPGDNNYQDAPIQIPIDTTDNGLFKLARWTITDAAFESQAGGSDFRIRFESPAQLQIRSIAVKRLHEIPDTRQDYFSAANYVEDSDGNSSQDPVRKENANTNIGSIRNGSWVRYTDYSYPEDFGSFDVEASFNANFGVGGLIQVYEADTDTASPQDTGLLLAEVHVTTPTGTTWNDYGTFMTPLINQPTQAPEKSLFLYFSNPDEIGFLFNVRNFRFGPTLISKDVGHVIVASDFDAESNRVDRADDNGLEDTAINFIRKLPPEDGLIGDIVGLIKNGTWIQFEDFNFGDYVSSIDTYVSCADPSEFDASNGGKIEIWTQAPNYEAGGIWHSTIEVSTGITENLNTFTPLRGRLSGLTGVHDLFFVFRNDDSPSSLFRLSSFRVNAHNRQTNFKSLDIGAPPLAGRTYDHLSDSFVSLNGTGSIGGSTDAFHYAYEPISGNFTLSGNIDIYKSVDIGSQAGIMIRSSLSADAPYLYFYATPDGQLVVSQRNTTGTDARVLSTTPFGSYDSMPKGMRVIHSNGHFSFAYSTDSRSWTPAGTYALENLLPNETFYMGYAIASNNAPVSEGARFLNVRVTDFSNIASRINYESTEGGLLLGDASQEVEYRRDGSAVEILANPGYRFLHWNDGVSDNPRQDTVITESFSVSAVFERVREPYLETPHTLPGIIQAEHFDFGGQSLAYNDTTPENHSTSDLREPDSVDLKLIHDGVAVAWIEDEEWLEYTVDVASGIYDLSIRVASPSSDASFRLLLDGEELAVFDSFETGGYSNWNFVRAYGIPLESHTESTLRVEIINGNFDLDYLEFTQSQFSSLIVDFRDTYGLPQDGSLDFQDTSGNGVPNILYALFGIGDPSSSNTPPLTLGPPITSGTPSIEPARDDVIAYSYVWPTEASGYTATVWTSTDLNNWFTSTTIPAEEQPSIRLLPYNDKYNIHQYSFPVSGVNRFIYLSIDRNPTGQDSN
ncbi:MULTISPECIES: carbohydrate-binding protein [unclassified Lentimonas]|uniref:carbohydrate-binding protein n=1 Tax=unclassified Lentimonas TaxID=2630993 RepID=UPI00132996A3|nr:MULTISPECIES: carbohydrate-binding protein [unclassified Lentimonas]CAA6680189.1 Endo-1,4-beta-xylanase A precursor (EC [Lentimonas sp. CC4]CAA6687057.1 Endo-1,4-beta-xylanase A precursor (EC [Lentimonas sp. CC6]CAA7076169.1 Endo-1,4-beta-xylanase A precursor (EC [Lentimonas sp. CC4]CAA7171182.1 Endo-1,4-beta-xylanase A precursor (EC [Lentimonas sp. CC21]CAA7182763.1 Endo-1,4-beta-xylanase A precursor (EC [Lentimonas sp. CC8]